MDPVATDPPPDPDLPATTPALTVHSGGEDLLGVLHVPSGAGPHPIVVLLHGFPGNERNFDLAQALRRAGHAALVFHYRGSWGVGGTFSWGHVLADRPVLLVGTGRDAVTPHELHHDPLVEAYAHGRLEHHVLPTDHALSDHRVTLARTIVGFAGRAG